MNTSGISQDKKKKKNGKVINAKVIGQFNYDKTVANSKWSLVNNTRYRALISPYTQGSEYLLCPIRRER